MAPRELIQKIHNIKLIVSDVDGILTDGSIIISSNGDEMKKFHVEDGMGVALASFANLPIAFLSGRYSEATTIRARELKIKYCYQGQLNKVVGLQQLCENYNVDYEEVCYIGDGLIDIPPMEKCGLAVTVPNAQTLTKEIADHITTKSGGTGVLSELIEWILTHQDRFEESLEKMRKEVYRK